VTERLTLDRFRELADAYGGVIARWPEQYREDSMPMALEPEAAAILANASALDETLDAWRVPAPAAVLHNLVLTDAPAPRQRLATRARLWWSGIGFATALAGAVAGTAAVAMVTPGDVSPDSGTSFGDVAE
jgi:hypothetical protein